MTTGSASYLTELHRLLNQHFNLAEIQDLCFQLNVDYESVPGDEKPSRIRALLLALGRNGRLSELITLVQRERPNVDWPPVPDDFEMPESLVSGKSATPANQYHIYGDIVQGDKIEGDKVAGPKIQTQTYIEKQVNVSGVEITDIEDLPPEPCDPPCVPPYQGLPSFDVNDYERFFGRESLTIQLVNRLHDTRFLAVVGASGSGKSSVVRAGVVPVILGLHSLEDGSEPPLGQWQALIMTSTARPLTKLAVTLFPGDKAAQSELHDQMTDSRSSTALAAAIAKIAPNSSGHKLLLVVDQFEELFTLCKEADQRQMLVDNLLTAAEQLSQVRIVITLRADFYDQAIQLEGLEAKLEQQQAIVTQMRSEELKDAILKPAEIGNWQLQAGLTEQMLAEVGSEPGALPLLSHALLETWKRRRGRTMTLSGYVKAGGIKGAIAQTATQAYGSLTPDQQTIAKQAFLRLTELGHETQDTRRRVELAEIGLDENTRLVLKKLADARLITSDKDVIEVAHEALIREWKTLRGWLSDEREGLIIHRRLTNAAQTWQQKEKDPSYLYTGLRLTEAAQWAETNRNVLNDLESRFLETSLEAEEQRQRNRRLVQVGGAVVLAILIMLGIGVVLINNERNDAIEAKDQEEFARGTAEAAVTTESEARGTAVAAQATSDSNANLAATRQVEAKAISEAVSGVDLLDTDKELALLLTIHALQQYRSNIVDASLREVLSDPGYTTVFISDLNGRGYDDSMMAWSQDGDEVLAWIDSGQVVAINPHTQEERVILNNFQGDSSAPFLINNLLLQLQDIEPGVWPAARQWPDAVEEKYSNPDREFILVQEGTITQLKRIEDNESICEVTGIPLYYSLPWNVNGTQFFTHDQTVIDVWDSNCNHVSRLTGDAGAVAWAEWSANGEFIAGVSETGHGRVWHLEPILAPNILPDDWFGAWSPDGSLLATNSIIQEENDSDFLLPSEVDNSVWNIRIWNPVSQKTVVTIPYIDGGRLGISEWEPEDKLAVVLRESDKAEIWDTETWQLQTTLIGHQAAITDSLLTPDGSSAVTASEDGTVRIWDITNGELLIPPLAHPDAVTAVSLSPDGKQIATGSEDGFVRIWNIDMGELVTEMQGHTNTILSISWHPDGNRPLLLSEQADETILWDLTNGTRIPLLFENETSRDAYWNATGSFLAGVTRANDAVVWAVDDWSQPTRIGTRQAAWNHSLPASNLIATQDEDSSILVWDADSGQQVDVFSGHRGEIDDIQWNHNGHKLATVGVDATIHIWERGNPVALVVLNTVESGDPRGEWSADGRYFAHKTQGIGVTIYQIEGLSDIACDSAVRNLSRAEITQNEVNLSGEDVCPGKPVPGEHYDLPIVDSSKG